jgi:sugar lactone lactonase YvrE
VSSTIFGGEDYGDLYATTAMGNDKATNGEHAGALFRVVDPGVKGVAEFFSRVGL